MLQCSLGRKKKFLASFVHIGEFIPGPCNDPLNCSSRQFSLVSPQRPFFCDRPFSFAPSADLSASAGGKRKKSWLCSAPVFGRWPGHLPSPRLARTNGSLLCSHSYCPDLGVSSGGNAGDTCWGARTTCGPRCARRPRRRGRPRVSRSLACARSFSSWRHKHNVEHPKPYFLKRPMFLSDGISFVSGSLFFLGTSTSV